ncbi:FecR family protein [Pedobacter sp. AW31-3R]|uniref:FecR family protein n=1 Tax=Pedobacter sp. AW31-3R TaxID=3445781 RepID=UPI003F9F5066
MNNLELSDYSSYETLNFFEDARFIEHILHPDTASEVYWTEVLARYPEKTEAFEEAKHWILMLRQQPVYTPSGDSEKSWNTIQSKINRNNHLETKYYIPLRRASKWTASVAALLFIFFFLTELMNLGKQDFQSGYGQMRSIKLPDESVAILNGNSHIHYVRGWSSDQPRELWMEGEASFSVKHVAIKNRFQQADTFKVHVNGLQLTVLGTQFNVKNRRGQTEIALLSGSLRIEKQGASAFSRLMKPGDIFIYDGLQLQKGDVRRTAKATQSWTRKELDLDGYTLKEIANILEDTYGYKVTMNVPDLENKRLSGTIPSGSAEDILFVIEKIFDVSLIKNKNQLTINHKTD